MSKLDDIEEGEVDSNPEEDGQNIDMVSKHQNVVKSDVESGEITTDIEESNDDNNEKNLYDDEDVSD